MWDKRAQVLAVHDGDTLPVVVIDQGFGDAKKINLRLDGVFAPELSQAGGPECRDFVTSWVAARKGTATWPFVVTTRMIRSQEHEVTTLGRIVGTLTQGQDSLNADIAAFVAASGYAGGTGSP